MKNNVLFYSFTGSSFGSRSSLFGLRDKKYLSALLLTNTMKKAGTRSCLMVTLCQVAEEVR